ncbi:hypothetical protein [Spirosoma jeollabukense]
MEIRFALMQQEYTHSLPYKYPAINNLMMATHYRIKPLLEETVPDSGEIGSIRRWLVSLENS